jgi:hypothetical protein
MLALTQLVAQCRLVAAVVLFFSFSPPFATPEFALETPAILLGPLPDSRLCENQGDRQQS